MQNDATPNRAGDLAQATKHGAEGKSNDGNIPLAVQNSKNERSNDEGNENTCAATQFTIEPAAHDDLLGNRGDQDDGKHGKKAISSGDEVGKADILGLGGVEPAKDGKDCGENIGKNDVDDVADRSESEIGEGGTVSKTKLTASGG